MKTESSARTGAGGGRPTRDEWEGRGGGRGTRELSSGFALLGSSPELRVTDHQTDRTDAAASAGTNLSVGTGEFSPPTSFASCSFPPVGQLNCSTMKMKPLLL